jgi:hypothetical protein
MVVYASVSGPLSVDEPHRFCYALCDVSELFAVYEWWEDIKLNWWADFGCYAVYTFL